MTMGRAIKVLQLVAGGAVVGLYAAKAFGIVGVEVTPIAETLGAGLGAAAVAILKTLHFA